MSSVDPKGTTPGLSSKTTKEPEPINMKCRNENGNCDNMSAVLIQIPGQDRHRMYRCTKCSHTWGINVGGSVNL